MARDYYRILGVDRGASEPEIKRAYRKLARELHPDVTGDDPRATERFKAITEAYEVLSDPQRRRSYDLFGARDMPPPGGPDGPRLDLDGVLDQLFPGRRKKKRPEPGTDAERTLTIGFIDAFVGVTRALDEHLKVVVPAGIDDGARLRLKGKGGKGNHGGPDGDLYVVVHVEPHAVFSRDGHDVLVEVVVPLSTALLGGGVDVPVPDGHDASVKMTVPAGTQGGRVFRLRGRGFTRATKDGARGDLLVTLQIRIPRVDPAERDDVAALLRRLER